MSEPYQIFVLIPDGIHAEKAIYNTHVLLGAFGGVLDEDSLLMLNETDGEEPEPTNITNADAALTTLAHWPTFGTIVYAMPEFSLTLSYKSKFYGNLIQVIKISMMEKSFERCGEVTKHKYVGLAQKLHELFQAKRTIMDWGIEYKGFVWHEELERLKQDELVGDYDMVDLQDVLGSSHRSIQVA